MKYAVILYLMSLVVCFTGCDEGSEMEPDQVDADINPIIDYPFTDASARLLPLNSLQSSSMDAEVIDIDQDGDNDIILAIEFFRNFTLINDGAGQFTANTSIFPANNHDSEDIAIADFDGNGLIDVLFVSEDDFVNEYYLQTSPGQFVDHTEDFPFLGTTNAVVTGDLNEDGYPDVLLGNNGQNVILINDGTGHWTNETESRLLLRNDVTQDLELGDVDGDGDLDLLVGNEDENALLINTGAGFFNLGQIPLLPGDIEETREADFGDIDGDGDLDIFFANVQFIQSKNPANRILINDGNGRFTDETGDRFIGSNNRHSVDGDFADIDGDGDIDLVIANAFGTSHQIMINENGVLHDRTRDIIGPGIGGEGIDVELADLNGDGLIDIYIGAFNTSDQLYIGVPLME